MPAYTKRPCDHANGYPRPDECGVCYLYVHDARYRALYDGEAQPPAGGKYKAAPRPRKKAPPRLPKKDMLSCIHLGEPTGELREVQEGFG